MYCKVIINKYNKKNFKFPNSGKDIRHQTQFQYILSSVLFSSSIELSTKMLTFLFSIVDYLDSKYGTTDEYLELRMAFDIMSMISF